MLSWIGSTTGQTERHTTGNKTLHTCTDENVQQLKNNDYLKTDATGEMDKLE